MREHGGGGADLVTRIREAGKAAYPSIDVDASRIEARVRSLETELPSSERAALCDADLYLAIALEAGLPAAVRVFEDRLVPEIVVALARMRLTEDVVEEVTQALRADLLVGSGAGPRIERYSGLGALSSWVRVSASRLALNTLRKTKRETFLDEAVMAEWPEVAASPAERHLRATYVQYLKTALTEALAALEPRQRTLLRQHLLDDLTIDELALLYRVHRSTCARWIADARAALVRATRKNLVQRLGGAQERLDSVLRYLESDIEISFSRILRAT
ncbi:MAG: sigma-70 family RNA polymerase sigma factor [Polyangiaceae bacterium]|nr:sigma-70 family RNA polymerase sigma factor [Polyangiaceae bacterium]